MRAFWLLGLVILGVVSCGPKASKVEDKISEIEIKIARLEDSQEAIKRDVEKTNERIDKLAQILSELRLKLERISYRLEQPSHPLQEATPPKQAKKEEEPPLVPVRPPKKEEAKPMTLEEAYKKALDLYGKRKLHEAKRSFLLFIKEHPTSKYTDNAYFWIGRIYHELGDLETAKKTYLKLIELCDQNKLVDCNKLPDTYLQLAKIEIEKGNVEEAKSYIDVLMERFPDSDASDRARDILATLKEGQ